jgi:hypothetical protein
VELEQVHLQPMECCMVQVLQLYQLPLLLLVIGALAVLVLLTVVGTAWLLWQDREL